MKTRAELTTNIQSNTGRLCLPIADRGETKQTQSTNTQEGINLKEIKLAQLNLQKIRPATSSLFEHLLKEKYTVACIQDCALTDNRPHGLPPSIPCYSSCSKNCFIVILDTSAQHIQVAKNNHSVFINLLTTEGYITIGTQYTAPSKDIKEDLQDWESRKGMSKKLIFMGDLNAHSKLWGYDNDDDRGTSRYNTHEQSSSNNSK